MDPRLFRALCPMDAASRPQLMKGPRGPDPPAFVESQLLVLGSSLEFPLHHAPAFHTYIAAGQI